MSIRHRRKLFQSLDAQGAEGLVAAQTMIPKSRDLFEDDPAPDLQHHFMRLRYATDNKGRAHPELGLPDLERLRTELSELHGATNRVQLKIWEKYGWAT